MGNIVDEILDEDVRKVKGTSDCASGMRKWRERKAILPFCEKLQKDHPCYDHCLAYRYPNPRMFDEYSEDVIDIEAKLVHAS